MAGQASKVQQVIQQAKTLFLNSSRKNSILDPGFAADLKGLKQMVTMSNSFSCCRAVHHEIVRLAGALCNDARWMVMWKCQAVWSPKNMLY